MEVNAKLKPGFHFFGTICISYRIVSYRCRRRRLWGSGPPFRRSAIPKGPPFWKLSFMVVAWNSSWYFHNQTTDPNPNPNRIPNRKLSLLQMAENGGPFGMVVPQNGGPTPAVKPLKPSSSWNTSVQQNSNQFWHTLLFPDPVISHLKL